MRWQGRKSGGIVRWHSRKGGKVVRSQGKKDGRVQVARQEIPCFIQRWGAQDETKISSFCF